MSTSAWILIVITSLPMGANDVVTMQEFDTRESCTRAERQIESKADIRRDNVFCLKK